MPTYGKIVDGSFVEAPGMVMMPDGTYLLSPSASTLTDLDYLPVEVHLPPGYVQGDSIRIADFYPAPDGQSIIVIYEFDDESSDDSSGDSSDSSEDSSDSSEDSSEDSGDSSDSGESSEDSGDSSDSSEDSGDSSESSDDSGESSGDDSSEDSSDDSDDSSEDSSDSSEDSSDSSEDSSDSSEDSSDDSSDDSGDSSDSSEESGDDSSDDSSDSSEDYAEGSLLPFGIYTPEEVEAAYWVDDSSDEPDYTLFAARRTSSSDLRMYLPAQSITVNGMPVEVEDQVGVFKPLHKGKWFCLIKCRDDGEAVPEGMSPEFIAKVVEERDITEEDEAVTVYTFPVAVVHDGGVFEETAYGSVAIDGLKHISKYIAFEFSVVTHQTATEGGYVYRMYLPKWGTVQCNNLVYPIDEADGNWLEVEKNKTYYCYLRNQRAHVSDIEPLQMNDRVFRIGGIFDA